MNGGTDYGTQVDVWSMGVCLLDLGLILALPFTSLTPIAPTRAFDVLFLVHTAGRRVQSIAIRVCDHFSFLFAALTIQVVFYELFNSQMLTVDSDKKALKLIEQVRQLQLFFSSSSSSSSFWGDAMAHFAALQTHPTPAM